MQTIGERLEEARKRKGISVREAAETTKIRSDYLQKFEANSFDIVLPPLYIRSFLRAYAHYLELDAEKILSDFTSVMTSEGKSGKREGREVYGRVDFGDASRAAEGSDAPASGRSNHDQAMLIKIGLFVGGGLLVLVAIFALVKVLTPAKPVAPSPAQPAVTQNHNNDSKENSLVLMARGPVRVKIVNLSDNQVLLPGLVPMAAGETKLIRYNSKLKVTVDDPSKLSIEINGQRQEIPISQYGFFFIAP